MMLIIIFIEHFISFKSKKFLLTNSNNSNLFFIIELMIIPVKIRVVQRRKRCLIESALIFVLSIVPYLGLSIQNQEKLSDQISLPIYQLVILESSNRTIRQKFLNLDKRHPFENQRIC